MQKAFDRNTALTLAFPRERLQFMADGTRTAHANAPRHVNRMRLGVRLEGGQMGQPRLRHVRDA
jgi:hypothetical protein